MRKNKSTWIIIVIVIVLLGFLFVYPRIKQGSDPGSFAVPCLSPNKPLLQHIHPHIAIFTDGVEEKVPANIGLVGCERALHTHDSTGELHVEAQDKREYTFGDFMSVWGKDFEREGYVLRATVDGEEILNPAGVIFEDGQRIVLEYTKI
jgi:hypothetical protein